MPLNLILNLRFCQNEIRIRRGVNCIVLFFLRFQHLVCCLDQIFPQMCVTHDGPHVTQRSASIPSHFGFLTI